MAGGGDERLLGGNPDLRHVRYVALSPTPPDRRPDDLPLVGSVIRRALLGAFAAGSLCMQVTGDATSGLTVGGLLGAASALVARVRGRGRGGGFALVPWGVLVESDDSLTAVRWSGVRSLDVRYRAARDGSVHARVSIDSVAGAFVGFASDAVDLGALAGDLEGVARASARPLAIDLEGNARASEGEPFADRILHAARTLVAEAGDELGLEPHSYREGARAAARSAERIAARLRLAGAPMREVDRWGLVAAIAGELRLESFRLDLARLSGSPNPGVAAVARAAIGRLVRRGEASRDEDDGGALAWFVSPEELDRLRAWRDAA